MTALNKQALRETAEKAASDSWGYDRDEFNEALTPSTVLALLDELEAAEKRIAELERSNHIKPCPKCNDTGMADSGGVQPWGEPIFIECDCRAAMLKGAEPVQGWIPCSERMPPRIPDTSTEYLVYETLNNMVQHDYWNVPEGNKSCQAFWNNYNDSVTHWMPLPAAPQQEVKSALEHGMQRYAGAMQKLSEGDD